MAEVVPEVTINIGLSLTRDSHHMKLSSAFVGRNKLLLIASKATDL
jgi:hypothetical protein